MAAWCERWNMKVNEEKTLAIYFTHRNVSPESPFTLNGRNIGLKYLGVIFDRRMTEIALYVLLFGMYVQQRAYRKAAWVSTSDSKVRRTAAHYTHRPFRAFCVEHPNAYLIIAIDGFTKFAFLTAVPTTKLVPVLQFLDEIFNMFGVTRRIVCDRESSFTSKRIGEYC
jgi:hypothetical protein